MLTFDWGEFKVGQQDIMTLHPSADVEDGWILCSFHSIACNLICGSTLYKASVSTQKSGIGKAMIFGNAAAILNASKSVLSSTRKKGSFPSAVATTYDRHITPIPDTRTIQSDPRADGVTPVASAE